MINKHTYMSRRRCIWLDTLQTKNRDAQSKYTKATKSTELQKSEVKTVGDFRLFLGRLLAVSQATVGSSVGLQFANTWPRVGVTLTLTKG